MSTSAFALTLTTMEARERYDKIQTAIEQLDTLRWTLGYCGPISRPSNDKQEAIVKAFSKLKEAMRAEEEDAFLYKCFYEDVLPSTKYQSAELKVAAEAWVNSRAK